ncbi:putative ankyrin repeat protein [Diplonema papillatum]|nr:putative ankyrin repeat protein [Diplonema papillatum]
MEKALQQRFASNRKRSEAHAMSKYKWTDVLEAGSGLQHINAPRPVSMRDWTSAMQRRRHKTDQTYHHCPWCCARCREEADKAEPDEVVRLRCAYENGDVSLNLLNELSGPHRIPCGAWPEAVCAVMAAAPELNLPFPDLFGTRFHGPQAARAALLLAAAAFAGGGGGGVCPKGLLLLHSVGSWSSAADAEQLRRNVTRIAGEGLGDPAETDAAGRTPLHYASCNPRFPGVELLPVLAVAMDGSSLCNLPDAGGSTPLHLAAEAGLPDVIRALLGLGASAAARDGGGATALHICVTSLPRGTVPSVLPLLCTPAAVASRSKRGWTALHVAAYNLSPAAVTILLQHGADPAARAVPECQQSAKAAGPLAHPTPLQLARTHYPQDVTLQPEIRSAFLAIMAALGNDFQ